MAATVHLPSVAPDVTPPHYTDARVLEERRWGENTLSDGTPGGPRDPLSKLRNNITHVHEEPFDVNGKYVEAYMAPKALRSDIGSLMPLLHNTVRRVPCDPTPSVIPRNFTDRHTSDGSFVLTPRTRKSLDSCNRNLYITTRNATVFSDKSAEITRCTRRDRLKTPSAQKAKKVPWYRQQAYDPFRYTSTYRESYNKNGLNIKPNKLPLLTLGATPKISLIEDSPKLKHVIAEGEDVLIPVQSYTDSWQGIRRQLGDEGWSLPYIQLKQRQPSYVTCVSADPPLDVPRGLESLNTKGCCSTHLCEDGITRDTPSALPNVHSEASRWEKCKHVERTRIEPFKYGQTDSEEPEQQKKPAVALDSKNRSFPNASEGKLLTKRSILKKDINISKPKAVTFNENEPFNLQIPMFPSHGPYYSLESDPVRSDGDCDEKETGEEGKEEKEEEDEDKNMEDVEEYGTHEMLESGWRRRCKLSDLQIPDFKAHCHSRHHQMHIERVPDLRDFTRYKKKVFFEGIHTSVFR